MNLNYIEIQHEKIEKIYHISDVHFRNVRRHDEYREVLKRFYDAIIKGGTKNSVIIIAGDIAHSKVEMSPELIAEMSAMLVSCSDLTDTIIIPGNHDCNLNNKNRLDVISPVVENLKHPHLHYLRNTGIFKCKNVLFSHFGIMDDIENYITHDKIPKSYLNKVDTTIALWHGPMDKSVTDVGYEISGVVTKRKFDGYDMVVMGDIHKYQCIQEYDAAEKLPEIVYSSSPIQQNHGEDIIGHGYCEWDVKTRKHTFHPLKNDYGFFTIDIKDGKLVSEISDMPKKPRLRVRCYESEPTEVKKILADIHQLVDVQETSYIRGDSVKTVQRGNVSKVPLAKLNECDFQNELIAEFVKHKHPNISKKMLKTIFGLNKQTNSKLSSDDKVSNLRWIPKKFTFDNMFSYGEGNEISFDGMSGINGIFASNASGKSSILDALCFCLFDKCSRTFKASSVMNESKMSFKCIFVFEIDGVEYTIKRTATRDKKGTVKVNVVFSRIVNGDIESLNDESRRSTNDIIRSYIGSYEDFVLTALSLQKNNSNFADKGQTDRKDLVARFLGITIFDKLVQIASNDSKEVVGALKKLSKTNFSVDIGKLEDCISVAKPKYDQMLQVYTELSELKDSNVSKIVNLNSKIVNLSDVPDDIAPLEAELNSKIAEVDSINIASLESECNDIKDVVAEMKTSIEKFESDNIVGQKESYDSLALELNNLETELELYRVDIKNKLNKVETLETHEYDENCEYCMKNVFIQDALKAKSELEELKPIINEKVERKNRLKLEISEKSHIPELHDEYTTLKSDFNRIDNEWHKCINRLGTKEKDVIRLENDIETIKRRIKRFHDSKDIITKNEEIRQQIVVVDNENTEVSRKLKIANEKILESNSQLEVWRAELDALKKRIKEVKELEASARAYEYYIEAIHRNGVPYDIICKSVPAIEKEVNEILSQIVDFNISIEMDGTNINSNIVYDDKSWPLELTSGMETFISNLAIRIALTNISNIPQTTFLAIDEGFGALDHEVMSSLSSLFTFLAHQFDFVLVISHIDTLRDLVDGHIEVKKENGFSSVKAL